MRVLTAAIVIGPLMLIGALPAAAGRSTLALGSGGPVRLIASDDSTADRDTYTQKARGEMQEWQRKLHDFGENAEAKGKEGGVAAKNDLNQAWVKADAASHRLQTVGDEGWKSAQTSFETASHDLAETWHRIHLEAK